MLSHVVCTSDGLSGNGTNLNGMNLTPTQSLKACESEHPQILTDYITSYVRYDATIACFRLIVCRLQNCSSLSDRRSLQQHCAAMEENMSNFSIQYARAVATGWTDIRQLEEAFPNKLNEKDIAKVDSSPRLNVILHRSRPICITLRCKIKRSYEILR